MKKRGDKFRTLIEDEERFFKDPEDVIDHVTDKVHFEVDRYALRVDLKFLVKREMLKLRDDCKIWRIAN